MLPNFSCFLGDVMENFPNQDETSLGVLDCNAVLTSLEKETLKKKRKNSWFSDKQRYQIGKCASINGPAAAAKKFKKSHRLLKFGESTTRSVRTKYEELLKKKKAENFSKISLRKRGRPLMLGTLDAKVQTFLHVLRRKGGVVNTVVAIATAKAFITRSLDEHLKCIDLESTSLAKSLFKCMGFKKRTCTTSKSEIRELAKKEAKSIFQHQIADHVERHSIPSSLIMNFDQVPLKYAPVANQTLARKGTNHVAVKRQSFKKAITATFGITFSKNFLPMKLIYQGKTERNFPKVKFPDSLSLSANEKHFSNKQESLKLTEGITTPYVEKERVMLDLAKEQPVLLIIGVFIWPNDRSCYSKVEGKPHQGDKSTPEYD